MEPNTDLTLGTASRLYVDDSLELKEKFRTKLEVTDEKSAAAATFKQVRYQLYYDFFFQSMRYLVFMCALIESVIVCIANKVLVKYEMLSFIILEKT